MSCSFHGFGLTDGSRRAHDMEKEKNQRQSERARERMLEEGGEEEIERRKCSFSLRLSVSPITLMNLSNAYMLTSIDLRIQNSNNICMLTSIDSGIPTGSPPTLMKSDKICHSHGVTQLD